MSFIVRQSGLLMQFQDLGRFGYMDKGLSQSGAMDVEAFLWGNTLLNNHTNATQIEFAGGEVVLETTLTTTIAVCGAVRSLKVNGNTQLGWCNIKLNKGDLVSVIAGGYGVWCYIGVYGGFVVPSLFASTATTQRLNLGPPLIIEESVVAYKDLSIPHDVTTRYLARKNVPVYAKHIKVHVIEGYQQNYFSSDAKYIFYNNTYQVSKIANRMGYRLQGERLSYQSAEIVSEAMLPGAIQIANDGLPIVLMSDCQSLGGYPKLGSVIEVDRWQLSQLATHNFVNFATVSPLRARQLKQQKLTSIYNYFSN